MAITQLECFRATIAHEPHKGLLFKASFSPDCLDPFEINTLYGYRLVIDGAVGTQTTMPFGSPEEVRQTVRRYARELGANGAYIASPTHPLVPEVSPENILAFVETVKEFGEII